MVRREVRREERGGGGWGWWGGLLLFALVLGLPRSSAALPNCLMLGGLLGGSDAVS
jgi:hypothetical protein